jgi:DNA modification methylase
LRSRRKQNEDAANKPTPTGLVGHSSIEVLPIAQLKPYPRNARTHSKKQIGQIARSIERFGFNNPVLIDEAGQIIAGHGRVAAAKQLGLSKVPVVRLSHLSEVEKRAYILADNRLAEKAGWDRELLAIELGDLSTLTDDFDVTITGFDTAEIDALMADLGEERDPADDTPEVQAEPTVSRTGDLWRLGPHRLVCGDARNPAVFDRLMRGELAQMVFTDPPYNVPILGHVGGRGTTRHREFAFAAGEMNASEFVAFLRTVLALCAHHACDSSIHFVCMDWRHVGELIEAGRSIYTELTNICVWVKTNAGQGSFYRSQHEFVLVFKSGGELHINTFELGQHGRSRTNLWTYAGVNTFRAGRMDELTMHPTVKPVALVADAMKDCSNRKGLVLDPFMGSGTTIMAGEKVGRRVYGIECDPAYVDVAIRRWQAFTRSEAILEETGQTLQEVQAVRSKEAATGEQTAPASLDGNAAGEAASEAEGWGRPCQPSPREA